MLGGQVEKEGKQVPNRPKNVCPYRGLEVWKCLVSEIQDLTESASRSQVLRQLPVVY